jgi:hypothetical protein
MIDFLGTEDVADSSAGVFKCIHCGTLNSIEDAKRLIEEDEIEEWNIESTKTAHREFKAVCARMGMHFGEGLLYLISLHEKAEHGQIETDILGVPSTRSLVKEEKVSKVK